MNTIGAADTITKAYIRENKVFADAFNYLIYDGRPVIRPENLHELDTTEIALPFNSQNIHNKNQKNNSFIQQYRDILKYATIKEDGIATYVLLGIENQTNIHYAMPVRNIMYDALQYGRQITDIASEHKYSANKAQIKQPTRAEYLSGFYKTDTLAPVITLVLHFNTKSWDGPLSLLDMMNPNLLEHEYAKYIQDYKIHLIDPQNIPDQDLIKFQSSLREVFGCIKYAKNKNKLANFIHNNPRMNIEILAARVIETITHTTINYQEGAETIDMCQAIEEMIQDGKMEGLIEGKIQILSQLIHTGKLTVSEAAALINMSTNELENKLKTLAH